ncbi:MAG: SLC13 family permease [Bacteroidales bacterium]|nr:SLC13 family permease [Candidatus Physcousia equi]
MNFSIIFVALCIAFMIWALIADRLKPGLILFSCVVLMLCAGILTPKECLEGFSNKGMITVALLFLVSEGVRRSGVLEQMLNRLLPKGETTVQKANMRLLPCVSLVSAFLNNTPVVVIFAPMIRNWARKMHLPSTKFLIPLSYATILGGICTLIGTSTNLVVDGLMLDSGMEGIPMFEIGKIGIIIAIVGLSYLICYSHYLLPDHREADAELDEKSKDTTRVEVLLRSRFPGLGKTIRGFDFYRHYGANVISIRRNGELLTGDWMNQRMLNHDSLILETDRKFVKAYHDSSAFLISSYNEDDFQLQGGKRKLAVLLLLFLVGGATIGELPFMKQWVPGLKFDMFFFACITTIIMAWTGMFNPRKYTKFMSWDVLVTIACAFSISKGMQNSGFADYVAGFIIDAAESLGTTSGGPYAMMAILFLITNLFTEIITNNAAAALAFPLALSVSDKLGVDPMPFFMCICVAASAAFSTPIGYQTNLLVQGIGGYKFTDYVKVGLPLNIIVFVICVFVIPLIWPIVPV